MRLLLIAMAVTLLGGCSTIVTTFVPSLEHCDEVSYVRKGNQFAVMANCKVRP